MGEETIILCAAAVLAGAINSIAGGGTLLTFPALFAALGSTADAAVVANATNTVALVPAALAALFGYRREMRLERRWALLLAGPSLLGGLIGSLLVVALPPELFKIAVPWLILGAALLFALQPQIGRRFGAGQPHGAGTRHAVAGAIAFQFLVGVYGGYFGAGMGILMLAALALIGIDDIHRMNAVKSLLGAIINGTSVVVFAASGAVNWPLALVMAVAAAIGGYVGAHTARRVNRSVVRGLVVALGFGLAAFYFYREFAR
ncbi:MAG: sulfite exporter TauE/SafE family protein [Pirellulales bacterium]